MTLHNEGKKRRRFSVNLGLFMLVVLSAFGVGCDFPRDPNDTLERVRRDRLVRVGVVENEPWVRRTEAEPAGVEAELVRGFAGEMNAQIEWVWGSEQEHIEALERSELDLVIGGLTEPTPWGETVGLTNSYFMSRITVGAPPGMTPPPRDIAGAQIAVRRGRLTASYLEDEDAVPVRVEDPFQTNLPVAAAEWELEAHGYSFAQIDLHTAEHVMAVPPGENAWLRRLEEFLRARRATIKDLVRREAMRR